MVLNKTAGLDMEALLDEVEERDISSIRRIVSEVITAMASPTAGIHEMKEIIEVDPPLSARVLRLANSAFYARGRTYQTIEEAVIWLGFDTVLRLILSQKVCELFADSTDICGYSRQLLWRHCTASALLARLIYRHEFGVPGETAYVCGLLHDIGIIVVDQHRHDAFRAALQTCASEGRPLADGLRAALGADQAQIGTALAERWRWPAEIVAAIGGYREPLNAPRRHARLLRTLYTANRSCHENRLGYGLPGGASDDETREKCLQALGMRPLALELLHTELHGEIASLESKGLL